MTIFGRFSAVSARRGVDRGGCEADAGRWAQMADGCTVGSVSAGAETVRNGPIISGHMGARAGCRPVATTGDAATRGPARPASDSRARERSEKEKEERKVGCSKKVGCSYFSLLFGRKGGRKGEKKEGKKEKEIDFSPSLEVCRRPRGARPLGPNNPGGGPAHASLPCRCTRGPVIQPVSLPLRPATAVP